MTHPLLLTLARRAAETLSANIVLPQRYGTAFHITPPVSNVTALPAMARAPVDITAWDTLTPPDQAHLLELDLSDVYLAWMLQQPGRCATLLLHIPEQTAADVTLGDAGLTWIFIAPGASVRLIDHLPPRDLSLHRLFVWQHTDSHFTYWGLRQQQKFLNERLHIELLGPRATTTVNHLTIGQAAAQLDIQVAVYHRAPLTHSHLHVRSLAADRSRTVYRGLIDVARAARGITGYQSGRALLTSRHATADILPQLEIRTNDVRCSHGVTATHLDELVLFYLRSRGLAEITARRLAMSGFMQHGLKLPAELKLALRHSLPRL